MALGSEYEMLHLDEQLRNIPPSTYRNFARKLCFRRLIESGFISESIKNSGPDYKSIDKFFEVDNKDKFLQVASSFVENKYKQKDRPYFLRLKKHLIKEIKNNSTETLNIKDENQIIKLLTCSDYPLLEKANIFLLYQDWSKSKNILESAKQISEDCKNIIVDKTYKCRHINILSHFQSDLYAQLLRECGLKQRYLGLSDFIDMSAGLPRNLLIILKHIYQWSVFNDESPFVGNNKISASSQREGVIEASDWFFRDAQIVESNGTYIHDGISRLATLFRDIRFSDKPAECSLSTFSLDLTSISPKARGIIKASEHRSLVINIPGGQRDRNTKRVDTKYQLNPMLAPRWDLPVHRRGAIALNAAEINAIFDPEHNDSLDKLIQLRISRMTAPVFGKNKKPAINTNPKQKDLF